MTEPRHLSIIGVLLLCGGAVLFVPPQVEERPEDHWLPVLSQPLVQRLGLVGQIEPGMSLTLTAPFEGHVQQRNAEPGQQVARGHLLLSLDTERLSLQLRDALAERLKAQSAVQQLDGWADGQDMGRARRALRNSQLNLADSERKLRETRTLVERGIVPRMEVDALVQQTASQRIDLKAAEAELAEVLPAEAIYEQDGQFIVKARLAAEQPTQPTIVTLGRATSQGVEVFGLTQGWVQREVAQQQE